MILSIISVLCAGIIIGSAAAAFYLALNIFVILKNDCKHYYKIYAVSAILGAVFSSIIYFSSIQIGLPGFITIIPGLACGFFTGMFIACITEVLNIMAIVRQDQVGKLGIWMAILFFMSGKFAGSLVYWIGNIFR